MDISLIVYQNYVYCLIQPPNSLMLASIKTRIRRLNKMARNTYLTISAKDNEAEVCTSPVSPLESEHQLPEWKFFNQVSQFSATILGCSASKP